MNLVSVAIKTAGLDSGGGYGTPASTPTYYLRIYSISGSTATLLTSVSAPNPGFTDGDWLRWTGLNVELATNNTYAFSFGIRPDGGGYAALAVATNAYAGGEIALIPISGGTITTGSSHNFDAVFNLGLQPVSTNILTDIGTANPTPGPNDLSQLSTSGNTRLTGAFNYFTDNGNPPGQTFTTGTRAGRFEFPLPPHRLFAAGIRRGWFGTASVSASNLLRVRQHGHLGDHLHQSVHV